MDISPDLLDGLFPGEASKKVVEAIGELGAKEIDDLGIAKDIENMIIGCAVALLYNVGGKKVEIEMNDQDEILVYVNDTEYAVFDGAMIRYK
jgi:hypothetical protein